MKKFIFSIVLLNVCAAYPFIIKDHTQTGATIAGVTLRSPKENGSVSAQLYGNLLDGQHIPPSVKDLSISVGKKTYMVSGIPKLSRDAILVFTRPALSTFKLISRQGAKIPVNLTFTLVKKADEEFGAYWLNIPSAEHQTDLMIPSLPAQIS